MEPIDHETSPRVSKVSVSPILGTAENGTGSDLRMVWTAVWMRRFGRLQTKPKSGTRRERADSKYFRNVAIYERRKYLDPRGRRVKPSLEHVHKQCGTEGVILNTALQAQSRKIDAH